MRYEHSQPGWVVRAVIAMCAISISFSSLRLAVAAGGSPPLASLFPVALMLVLLVLFHRLVVKIDAESVRVNFGVGLIGYTFLLRDIVSCHPVRSPWYSGWGIRKIRGGWLLNVSGYQAVELRLRSGKVYRIGTDDQDGLLKALETAISEGKASW